MPRSLREHINLLREFSVPLITGVVIAVVWANLDPASYHRCIATPLFGSITIHFLSNELFMVLFFGIAAVEITQSCLPGGELHPLSRALPPLFSTMGGVVVPILLYLGLNRVMGDPQLTHGWGIPTATDIALAWLAARAVFGEAHPAVSFLLLLAVADDAIGLAIISIFYPNPQHPLVAEWLLLTVLGMVVAYLLRQGKVRSYWPYILFGGGLSWTGLYRCGLHPALALVFIVPFLPHARHDSKGLFEDEPHDTSPLVSFEREWKVIVDLGLLLFGLANAGVEFSQVGVVTWLVLASLFFGKTIGIFSFGMLAVLFGFRLPKGLGRRELLVIGLISGTGFTVALFVADAAFVQGAVLDAAKMGAMGSIGAALVGLVAGKVLGIRRRVR